ncbi:hypothetical protein ACFWD7_39120 [Streptomyces mirabilis]|uniref:hypothetical protein n=1 Tax=Streptomyces mirabilis TaxID=68239 RepID=UPI0028F70379|nr:hypothetical protein [Streptomyces mirabilis]
MVTSYTLCFGGLMLLGGRVADVFGAHRTVLAGIAVFTDGSLVTRLATGAPMLLGGALTDGPGWPVRRGRPGSICPARCWSPQAPGRSSTAWSGRATRAGAKPPHRCRCSRRSCCTGRSPRPNGAAAPR